VSGVQASCTIAPVPRPKNRNRSPAKSPQTAPAFVSPMAAQSVSRLPEGPEWLYEVKWDGYRALLIKDGERVQIRSRNDKDLTRSYPGIQAAARKLGARTVVIDGEVVALGPDGRPSFQALQHRTDHAGHAIVYYAFDVLHLNGRYLTAEPLDERRAHLTDLLPGDQTVLRESQVLDGSAVDVAQAVRATGLEGVIAKRRDAAYEPGERSGTWVKLKLDQQQEFVVGGYRGNGADSFDSLLVAVYEGRRLLFAGKVRAGFTTHVRRELAKRLKPLIVKECPFVNLPDERRGRWGGGVTAEDMRELTWTKPGIVVQIRFVEWTAEGRLRHASFVGVREDKKAAEVQRET
jgi:bifunctional non-homologous end joining protein LigD